MFTPSPQSQDQPGCPRGAHRWGTKQDKEAGRGLGLPHHRVATVKVIPSGRDWAGKDRASLAG